MFFRRIYFSFICITLLLPFFPFWFKIQNLGQLPHLHWLFKFQFLSKFFFLFCSNVFESYFKISLIGGGPFHNGLWAASERRRWWKMLINSKFSWGNNFSPTSSLQSPIIKEEAIRRYINFISCSLHLWLILFNWSRPWFKIVTYVEILVRN